MIQPVGMNNSAMNVERIRVPRRNNMQNNNMSFKGLNAQKVQEGASGFISKAVEYVLKAKDAVVGFFGSEAFQKIKDTVTGAIRTVINKAGELYTQFKNKGKDIPTEV